MKKSYKSPYTQVLYISTASLMVISGGDSSNNVNVSTQRDDSNIDNRVKDNGYNVWDDDWSK